MTADRLLVRDVAAALDGAAVRLGPAAIDVAIAEGVGPLLAASPAVSSLDGVTRERLLVEARGASIHAAALDDELRRLLPALAAGGVHPIVIKGAHLAHAVYRSPALRPRTDTDLLIAPDQRERAAAALRQAGYVAPALTSGRVILGQFVLRKHLGPGVTHDVDVHWRAAAPLVFDGAFDSTVVAARGVPLPALGPAARGPSAADALALACVHVVAHHWPDASLRWWYDIRLLAAALGDEGRRRFTEAVSGGRYRAVAIAALDRARAVFPSVTLDAAIAPLRAAPPADEPSAALTRADRRGIDDFLLDLKVAGWRRGATLVREHLLPPPAYMRLAFAGRPLPIAYAERLVRAVTRRTIG
jgi:hypothetical protein